MFIDAARRIARLARLIDQEKQAARCEALALESETAFAGAFINSETGMVGLGSQSEQSFALGFGVVPEASRPAVFDHLVKDLNKPEDSPRLSTGIYGTRQLLEQLPILGRNDLAYALANRNTFPSWGWMLEKDATTLWEHWAGSDNTFSNNHPMFGSISAWFFRWLGGIQLAPDAVGFDRIVIRPQPVPDLKWVKCSHRSVRGMIESNWSVNAEGTEFDIVIPAGTTAIVELPASAGDRLTESGDPIKAAKGIKVLPAAPALHRLQVGGGRYRFIIHR
jgi:alpha-L-rhamnosidase